jgi:Arc/MetJ-type ribon-helix-helix transcriptional regulator
MASPVSVRLDKATRSKIAALARRKRQSQSGVIREAVNALYQRETNASPFEAVRDLIGVVHGGDPTRSENAGRKFREYLRKRRGRP